MHNPHVEKKHSIDLVPRCTSIAWKSDWYTVDTNYKRQVNEWLIEGMNEWELAAETEEMKYHLHNKMHSPLGEGHITIYNVLL